MSSTSTDLISNAQHYVRVTRVLHQRFVEFEYSIGDPTLCVELVLPFAHFTEFCERYRVHNLTPEQVTAVELDRLKWRNGAPGHYGNCAENCVD